MYTQFEILKLCAKYRWIFGENFLGENLALAGKLDHDFCGLHYIIYGVPGSGCVVINNF